MTVIGEGWNQKETLTLSLMLSKIRFESKMTKMSFKIMNLLLAEQITIYTWEKQRFSYIKSLRAENC